MGREKESKLETKQRENENRDKLSPYPGTLSLHLSLKLWKLIKAKSQKTQILHSQNFLP